MSQQLTGEHLYYNFNQTSADNTELANFSKTYTEKIINEPMLYTLSIDGFRIPVSVIPIFYFNSHQTGGLYDYYTVELEYNGTYSGKTGVQFIPTSPNLSTTDPEYYGVWTFDIFIKMINNAIKTAFSALSGSVTLPSGSVSPFFEINLSQGYIALNAQQDIYESDASHPIKLYCNQYLFRFLDGLALSEVGSLIGKPATNGRDALFLVYDMISNIKTYNSTPYCQMINNNLADIYIDWNISKGIYFVSNTIPCRPEIMPTSQNNLINAVPIICKYDFLYTQAEPKPFLVQYMLSTPYKVIDLIANNPPMNKIDIQVLWFDKLGNSYPLTLMANDALSIRICFQKKK